ncbi:maleate isomerase [Flavobacterium gossypii]|uniref:Maleate isomerase n=2 Tax=Flavobacterium TaxID=237 RepID=A0A495M4M6_9FLAO|nr:MULTISPECIES: Asp/Glu racemase [Flavobacterium]MBA9075000.1 maleate isomerase [Flavobacterium gossypii]RKS20418.1 maleate isomerase [Flavobacterium endophyticum]
MKKYKIGQIVPSSNVTMETEIPALFRSRETIAPERFTFHSSRMRMKKVTKEELEAMDAMSLKCAQELSDAQVDVMGYACLVAIMSMGRGYHCVSETNLHEETVNNGFPTPIVTSAGALINGLKVLGAKKVAVITPYMKPLTQLVVDYIEHQGFEVVDFVALEIADNLEVAAQDPMNLLQIYKQLNLKDVDVLVASACVQMPSLEAVDLIEKEIGIPVTTAAICTTYEMMKKLGLDTKVPIGGALLSGKY